MTGRQGENGIYTGPVGVNRKKADGDVWLENGDQLRCGNTIFKFLSGSNIEAQYHDEIYRLTTTDGLTQIYNKRYFLETLERELGGQSESLARVNEALERREREPERERGEEEPERRERGEPGLLGPGARGGAGREDVEGAGERLVGQARARER